MAARPEDSRRDPEAEPKRRIFDAAVRLFARNGFAATGVRELAREAEVNLATVNYFFGSKKGLLTEILDDFFSGFLIVLNENLAGDDEPLIRLRRTIKSMARYFAEHRDKMLIVIAELPHDDPDITDAKAEAVRRIIGTFQARVLDDLERTTGVRPPLAVVGPALTALVASQFLFRPVIEKIHPEGFDATSIERYPDLIAELYLTGLGGVLARAKRE